MEVTDRPVGLGSKEIPSFQKQTHAVPGKRPALLVHRTENHREDLGHPTRRCLPKN